MADEVFEVTGKNPLLEIALELERIALQDDYFVKRKLYPNVDFYSGLIYEAMGFQSSFFPVMFAIPRTVGWVSQWEEMVLDQEQKIARPRQIYVGHPRRDCNPHPPVGQGDRMRSPRLPRDEPLMSHRRVCRRIRAPAVERPIKESITAKLFTLDEANVQVPRLVMLLERLQRSALRLDEERRSVAAARG